MSSKHVMKVRQNLSQRLKQIGKMKLGQFLSLSEDKFESYLREVEADPLFQELKDKYHLIGYKRFRDVSERPSSLALKEELVPQQDDGIDIESLLETSPEVLSVLKKVGNAVGLKQFTDFLYKGTLKISQIAQRCSLSPEEVRIFKDFINKFQIQSLFASSSSFMAPSTSSRFFKIASIEKGENGLLICPLDKESYLIKGRYFINYSRFEKLIAERKFTEDKINKISAFFKKLDLINRRTTALYQVLYQLKEIQRKFFETGNPEDLVPLTQSELANRIGICVSTVSRAIAKKSILTPQGEEKPLKFFFSKRRVKNLLSKILTQERKWIKEGILSKPFSDEEIRKMLKKRYGIEMSRRTVCKYRKMLKVPSSYQRG